MGGDHGPQVVIPAAISTLQRHSDIELILVGDEAIISAELAKHQFNDKNRMKIHHASQTVGMDEPPSSALRGKKILPCG